MIKIKICGIKRIKDVEYLNMYLPDYAGFIFAKSKRQVTEDFVISAIKILDRSIKTVGVFVDEDINEVVRIVENCGLDIVQLHGYETMEYIEELKARLENIEVWKAIAIVNEDSLNDMKKYKGVRFVLDTKTEDDFGSSEEIFDWEIAKKAKEYGDIVLAGGLTPKNIKKAKLDIQPFAVDASIGVETNGIKDKKKIMKFIYAIKRI